MRLMEDWKDEEYRWEEERKRREEEDGNDWRERKRIEERRKRRGLGGLGGEDCKGRGKRGGWEGLLKEEKGIGIEEYSIRYNICIMYNSICIIIYNI